MYSKSITQSLSVGAICAERTWRRRSVLFRHISVYTDDNQTERRRHMRSAQMAATFKCLRSQKKTLKTSPPYALRADGVDVQMQLFSKKRSKRRRHMRSAQMAATFKCNLCSPPALSRWSLNRTCFHHAFHFKTWIKEKYCHTIVVTARAVIIQDILMPPSPLFLRALVLRSA